MNQHQSRDGCLEDKLAMKCYGLVRVQYDEMMRCRDVVKLK